MYMDWIKQVIKYVGGKPESLKDYFKLGEWYISKILLLRLFVVVVALVLLVVYVGIPVLSGKLWATKMVINTPEYHTASGKVEVFRSDNVLLYKGTMTDGRITGTGELYNGNLLVYYGEFVNEKYYGVGKLYQKNKLLYEGDFVDNLYHGTGVLYYPDGTIQLEGTFKNGLCHGSGTQYDEIGNIRYQGAFLDGIYEGKGILYREDGSIEYEGNFVNGKFEGNGKLYYENGTLQYEGNFAEDAFDGSGVLYTEEGKVLYTGEFKDNTFSGTGTLYSEETGREIYTGEFSEGIFSGTGTLYDEKGQDIYTGNYYEGEIDFPKFCDAEQSKIKEVFGEEDELLLLDYTFLLSYEEFQIVFEFDYVYEETSPVVSKIKIFGSSEIDGVANGKQMKEVQELFSEGSFSEYTFLASEEDITFFSFAGENIKVGKSIYSVKYILEDYYIRTYTLEEQGEIIYYEIGGF